MLLNNFDQKLKWYYSNRDKKIFLLSRNKIYNKVRRIGTTAGYGVDRVNDAVGISKVNVVKLN